MRYIFLLILIAASIGIFVVFVNPRFEHIQSLRSELVSYQSQLATAQKLQAQREALIATYNSIQKTDLDNLKTLLPDSVDNIRLIIQLDSLAQKNGLTTVRDVTFDTSTQQKPDSSDDGTGDASPYGTFKISLQTTGSYQNFLSFISDVEANLRLVDITDVTFQPLTGTKGVSANNFQYKVDLNTYWLKQ